MSDSYLRLGIRAKGVDSSDFDGYKNGAKASRLHRIGAEFASPSFDVLGLACNWLLTEADAGIV